MNLTGECKEAFEKWYLEMILVERLDYNKFTDKQILGKFYRSILSAKYGVYADFFDSLSLRIDAYAKMTDYTYMIQLPGGVACMGQNYKTRSEARSKVIEKANELYNKEELCDKCGDILTTKKEVSDERCSECITLY